MRRGFLGDLHLPIGTIVEFSGHKYVVKYAHMFNQIAKVLDDD